jgi:D-alanyl-lipoteichoic acid acyltransferase DltB (MBOAT superfamily)
MTLAYDYPLMGIFWTLTWLAIVVGMLAALFYVIIDVIRRRDLRGIAKAGWLALVFFLPFIGVFGYLVFKGAGSDVGVTNLQDLRQVPPDHYPRTGA